jgi:hypothetical protein
MGIGIPRCARNDNKRQRQQQRQKQKQVLRFAQDDKGEGSCSRLTTYDSLLKSARAGHWWHQRGAAEFAFVFGWRDEVAVAAASVAVVFADV